jgi:hypothetical protein
VQAEQAGVAQRGKEGSDTGSNQVQVMSALLRQHRLSTTAMTSLCTVTAVI